MDDLTIAKNRTHPDSSQLHVILDSFSQWTENNSLSLNPAKCQALQICFKTDVPHPTELKINGCSLNFVDHAKILGVWLQHDLSWDKNISEMISKTNRRLYMLRMLKRFGFKKDELITVYKGYIRPLLEYADVVWNSSLTLKQTKTIEQVQRRACRIVLVIIFCHIPKRLVIARLSHWPLGGKTIALSLPKGLLILKGQRIFFHLLGWRVIPGIFTMLSRSPNCVLGLRVLKIALSLTSLSC